MIRFLFLFLFCFSIAVFAQPKKESTSSISGEIYGQILDSASQQGLEFAAISLYQKETNQIITGAISTESGKFDLTQVPVGNYYLTIQFVGYPKKTIPNIIISAKDHIYNLGKIELVSDNLLKEVIVDGSTPIISYDIDKKIIDVSNLDVATGQTAVQILENSPSVMVQNDGTVLLRGSSSFTLFIDGRPTAMDASTALATIPASTIKTIEIITNPSAKYESEGVSGIMNIVTKSDKLEGVSLLANVTGGNYNNYAGDVQVSVRNEKTEFNVGLDYRNRSSPQDEYNERVSTFDTSTAIVRSTGTTDWGGSSYGANGEFIWFPNSGHTFTVGTRLNRRKRQSLNELFFEELEDDVEVYNYYNTGDAVYDITSTSSYLTYRLNINRDKEHYLELRGVYNYRYSDDEANIDYFDVAGIKTGGRKNIEKGPSNMLRFNVDYSKKFLNEMSFEAGSQIQFATSGDINENYEYNALTNEYELQKLFTSNADYVRNIFGFYSLVKGNKSKLGYQLGLRAEYTDRSISSDSSGLFTAIKRLDWFPTVHLSYQLPQNYQVLLNYSRRIERPRSYFLEPFITWRNAYSIYSGNPDLSPEYINAFELNLIKTLSQKGFISLETYVRFTDNFISRIQVPYDTNMILTTPLNVGRTFSIGMEPSFSYKILPWWKMDVALNLFRYEIISQHEQLNSSQNFNWNSRLTNTFPLKEGWNLQFASRYIGPANTVQGRQEGYFTMNGSVRKSFSDNKYALVFQVTDIFSSIREESFEQAGNVQTYTLIQPNTPFFTLTFSLRLNNYDKRNTTDTPDDF